MNNYLKSLHIIGTTLILFGAISSYALPGIFVNREGRHTGDITVNSDGEVTFKGTDGRARKYLRREYRYVKAIPVPQELVNYEKLFLAKEYDKVASQATKMLQTYQNYGYGEFVAYYEAQSKIALAKKRTDQKLLRELDTILARGLQVRSDNNEFYFKCIEMQIENLLMQPEKVKQALNRIDEMIASGNQRIMIIAIATRADYYYKKGDKEQTVVEYTKLLTLFTKDNDLAKAKCEEAKKRVNEILGAKNPRAQSITNL